MSTSDTHDDLVLERPFRAAIDDVWAGVTETDRLARWYGTWTGEPADGFVMVTMNAEAEPGSPMRYDIDACEPPRLLSVSARSEYGTWKLTLALSQHDDTTTLVFRHHDVDRGAAGEIGAGWEWYLDRLAASIAGTAPPTLADFDGYLETLRGPEST
jgi:uncharacterized protein YndB with AHSA1/START domain